MDHLMMQKVIKFILQTNIEDVIDIYKGKVDPESFLMLQKKAEKGLELRIDNSKAWLYFINQLNGDHSQILADYIDVKLDYVTEESFMF